jgi:hypothetical protein
MSRGIGKVKGYWQILHFHGTPITPRAILLELGGLCFCVSYSDARDTEVCHEIGQSVMLDNGAFSYWKTGKATDWDGYYAWCGQWLEHWTTWAVIPDIIDGTEQENDWLIREWPFGDRGAPVWHMHESLDRLRFLVSEWPLVCIGSSGAFATIGSPAWKKRMSQAMATACDRRGVPFTRLHMLRGLAYSNGPYPLYSADSTNIARHHAGDTERARRSALRMASEIDARQTPARWVPPAMQGTLPVGSVAA